ncbi:hypothetical protein B0A52_02720 [Exophiala mesophila]|uniref:Uncharacterized protein n=1 Tax=Exophiala mesophila TaxID=212818 RepID=A0A438NDP4_EXOME|nr:hypothetical protein B0A52_02720 [Exophiala mesophila]
MPPGALGQELPDFKAHLTDLYLSLLETVNPQQVPTETPKTNKTEGGLVTLPVRDLAEAICCAETTECMLLKNYKVPFCWDRFTTNYFLPDDSYGSITSGIYNYSSGGYVNLITGDYEMVDGSQGNIYAGTDVNPPNTSTLQLPVPFTSSGIGSAIPATEVGSSASYPSTTSTISESVTETQATETTSQGPTGTEIAVPSNTWIMGNMAGGGARIRHLHILLAIVGAMNV